MELQTVNNLVDHLAIGAHRDADEIEIGTRNRFHRLAIGGIMRRLEHVLSIDRRRDVARECTIECTRQRRTIGTVDQDRLADQRKIFRF